MHSFSLDVIFLLVLPGDVVAHVFTPQEREFYDIERFYSKAHIVPLPFETESSIEIL